MSIFSESWHRRLATFYGPLESYEFDRQVDFCRYFWAVVKGTFSVIGLIVLAGFFMFPVGSVLAWLAYMLVNFSFVVPNEVVIIAIFFASVILGAIMLSTDLVYGLSQKLISPLRDKLNEDSSNFSFVGTWWYSLKNKVCVPVTIKGKSNEDNA